MLSWIGRCPIAEPNRWQLSVLVATEALSTVSVNPLLTGAAMRAVVDGGKRPTAITTLSNGGTETSIVDLIAVNALPPFAEQLCAGGRVSASPSRALAALWLIDQALNFPGFRTYWSEQKQAILKKACYAFLSRHETMHDLASVLYVDVVSDDEITAVLSSAVVKEISDHTVNSFAEALARALKDLPAWQGCGACAHCLEGAS